MQPARTESATRYDAAPAGSSASSGSGLSEPPHQDVRAEPQSDDDGGEGTYVHPDVHVGEPELNGESVAHKPNIKQVRKGGGTHYHAWP